MTSLFFYAIRVKRSSLIFLESESKKRGYTSDLALPYSAISVEPQLSRIRRTFGNFVIPAKAGIQCLSL